MIPFIDLKKQYAALKDDIDARMQAVLDHGQFILGPEVVACEKALAEYTGARYALTCSSGTDAAVLALMALDIGPGDEVIIPGFSFIATAETIVLVGARPVFVDIRKDSYNIDVDQIEAAITSKTKAIMPVGLFGQPAEMDAINQLAATHNLHVIEDAAQSFGATYKGRKSCHLSPLACTSFFPAKPMGCYGDGGAVFTDSEDMLKKLQSLRMHGQAEDERYKHIHIGLNARMDTLQCAVILAKLQRFDWEVQRRHEIGARYTQELRALEGRLLCPQTPDDSTSVYAQYTIWLENRDDFRAHLQAQGIPTAVHYPLPMYKQPAYQHLCDRELENSLWASRGVVSLPMHPDLEEATQDQVVAAVKSFFA